MKTSKDVIKKFRNAASLKLDTSESKFQNLISQVPVLIYIFTGPTFILETINEIGLEIWGKTFEQVINKSLFDIEFELDDKMKKVLHNVYTTGVPFIENEMPVQLKRSGKPETAYFNSVCKPLRDVDNKIYGIMVTGAEITETVNARKQVEESERRIEKERKLLNDFFNQMPAIFAIFKEPEHVIEFANPAFIELIGGRNAVGKTLIEAVPEKKDQGFIKLLDHVYKTGETFTAKEMPTLIDKGNGKLEQIYLNLSYHAIKNHNDKIVGIRFFAYDVTEQVNSRKLIEESEKRFSNILAQSLMEIAIFKGPDMVVEFANEKMLIGLGKGNAVINIPLLVGVPELKSQIFPKLLSDVYTTGIAFEGFESKAVLVRNGIPVDAYFNFVYQPYRDVDNSITGVTVFASEVTEQVLAKKQIEKINAEIKKIASDFKLATDSAKVGIWSLDLITLKLDWSDMHKKMWGLNTPSKDLTYEDWYASIVPEDKEMAIKKVEDASIFPGFYDLEYRINRINDGALVWIKSTGLYHYDIDGIPHTFTGVSLDITEQKRIDAELIEAKTKAETAMKTAELAAMSKQQFLSNMSHEIRTPMNAIIGFTKVLMKTDLSQKQQEYVTAVKCSGDVLIILINDILDLAKVDAGKMIFVNTPFKISNSITTILHLFEPKIQESNLILIKEYDSKIPKIILGDAIRLHQILINLLSNAIKFTIKGKITLSVNLIHEDDKKVALEFKISDTGIGIPQHNIATIFENFEQVHNINSNVYGGTGLGLAIVKQLVEKQGGTVSVVSKVDEGSTFTINLSFDKTLTKVDFENDEEDYQSTFKTIKVLVVEDVKLNQLLMRTILDDFKFECDMADNGKIAIEKLQTNTYDIILMDLQMPIMNGFEATEYIRTNMNIKTPIIALTADVTTVDVAKCKAIGMNDYISKPLDEKILYSKILDLIKSK